MREQHASTRQAIEAALLDYQRTPDRHDVASRRPALLFDSMRDVLQLAGGKPLGHDGAAPAACVVEAARSFVRAALLYPGASHYAVLGVTGHTSLGEIKERYRALMRLVHPDFATKGASWPPDAASRINLANDVLSSPQRRAAYDESLAQPAIVAAASRAREEGHRKPAAPQAPPPPADPRKTLRSLAAAFGALATLVLAGSWLTATPERDMLVQKAPGPGAEPAARGARVAKDTPEAADTSWPPPQSRLAVALRTVLPGLAGPLEAKAPPAAPAAAPLPKPIADPVARSEATEAVAAAPAAAAGPLPAPAPAPVAVAAAPPVAAPAMPVAAVAAAQAPAPLAAAAPPAAPVPLPVQPPAAPTLLAAARTVPPPVTGPPRLSVSEVQPLLVRLLHHIESGRGDNVISELDFGTRIGGDAQALARQIDLLFDGVRPVRIMRTEFKGEPQDGRLTVVGHVTLQVRDPAAPTRVLKLTAEFAETRGAPVLSRLSATP